MTKSTILWGIAVGALFSAIAFAAVGGTNVLLGVGGAAVGIAAGLVLSYWVVIPALDRLLR